MPMINECDKSFQKKIPIHMPYPPVDQYSMMYKNTFKDIRNTFKKFQFRNGKNGVSAALY